MKKETNKQFQLTYNSQKHDKILSWIQDTFSDISLFNYYINEKILDPLNDIDNLCYVFQQLIIDSISNKYLILPPNINQDKVHFFMDEHYNNEISFGMIFTSNSPKHSQSYFFFNIDFRLIHDLNNNGSRSVERLYYTITEALLK